MRLSKVILLDRDALQPGESCYAQLRMSEELDAKFVAEATAAGFTNLKGHRSVGGMRASIYNAMPTEGVEKLCDFIKAFDKNN